MQRFVHILTTPITSMIMRTALAASLALGVIAISTPAEATGWPELTSGRFHSTALGVERGYHVRGGATMLRTDHGGGRTVVASVAWGLQPNTEYMSHVHNAPCSTGGGGHYQREVGGAVDRVNEIWPILRTGPHGVAFGYATHDDRARPEAQSVVIHDPSDGGRIACLDLT
jgi:hypothetical protein